jgi:hypothetical protein
MFWADFNMCYDMVINFVLFLRIPYVRIHIIYVALTSFGDMLAALNAHCCCGCFAEGKSGLTYRGGGRSAYHPRMMPKAVIFG